MKKFIAAAVLICCMAAAPFSVFAQTDSPAASAENWSLTRTQMQLTDQGIELKQTEMGTPDNHAIAILEVPFEGTDSFEITFRMSMNEYVSGGHSANDVWTGIGVMGLPKFINWRNSVEYGLAKDSPGLFTRFFNYSGDLRYEGSVYQENYKTAGDDPSGEVVDTWQLYEGNAGASADSDVTFRFVWEEQNGSEYYNCYINGNCITASGQAAFIERDVIFPQGKIYLLVVMNTQEDDFNDLSKVTIKSVNGTSFVSAAQPGEQDPGGCASSAGTSCLWTASFALFGLFSVVKRRRQK